MKIFSFAFSFIVALAIAGCSVIKKPASSSSGKVQEPEQPVWATKGGDYQPANARRFDLINTKLYVSFDWSKKRVNGEAILTLKPYFYPQDTLLLDAKNFDLHEVKIAEPKGKFNVPIFFYDSLVIKVVLPRTYQRNDTLKLHITYTAKPEERKTGGSEAIASDKGLYFINADGSEPGKPRQIWTQGETQANSCWFPTIDSPNEKMTQDIYITVDSSFVTLSNGSLMYSAQNSDGTRTDYWRQTQPHAPYLTMLAVGKFAIVKDSWRGKQVNYYVEPEYRPYAKTVFGNTPEMMEFFSNLLDYPYPWDKYSQVVVRDFVSGAMENTSATVMMEGLHIDNREALDRNWDFIIAHELFHHWFGDLVTCESWSNLPLNESFANYSEYLWEEYKFGKDAADFQGQSELDQYLQEAMTKREPLIRYRYHDREDMFDSHSYAKGGRILHMLRKQVGDTAFFESLRLYLKRHAFQPVEVHQLRLAFEEVTGKDLNWFFNQWFMAAGHPELLVTHKWSDTSSVLTVSVYQLQDTLYAPVYKLPLAVDVWVNGEKIRNNIVIDKKNGRFDFKLPGKPEAVVFDGETQLVGTVKHSKTKDELLAQYRLSDRYLVQYESVTGLRDKMNDDSVRSFMNTALKDDFWKIRSLALDAWEMYEGKDTAAAHEQIAEIAKSDPHTGVRADAIRVLARKNADKYTELFRLAMQDSSYLVTGAGLEGYVKTDAADKAERVDELSKIKNASVAGAVAEYYVTTNDSTKYDWFVERINSYSGGSLYRFIQSFGMYASSLSADMQARALELLQPLATTHAIYWIRFSAYQAISTLDKVPELEQVRKKIRDAETNEKLQRLYKAIP